MARLCQSSKLTLETPSLLSQEPGGLFRGPIAQTARTLLRFEAAGRCGASEVHRGIQELPAVAAILHRRPRGCLWGLQARDRWMLGPLVASPVGIWGILRPPPAVIPSPHGRGLRGLSRKGRFRPVRAQPSTGTGEALLLTADSLKTLMLLCRCLRSSLV